MNLEDAIFNAMKRDFAARPGVELPPRNELIARYGGTSNTMGHIVIRLEKENVVRRLSPRKFVVNEFAETEKIGARHVGLINFDGHIYGDFSQMLIPRLYDRKMIPNPMPIAKSSLELSRVAANFLNQKFDVLLLHNFTYDPGLLRHCRAKTAIELFSPGNEIPFPTHKIFHYMDFYAYDALKRLRAAGYRVIELLLTKKEGPRARERDLPQCGVERFAAEHPEVALIRRCDIHDMRDKPEAFRRWAETMPREVQAVLCRADFDVITARRALRQHTRVDYRDIQFIGYGNTDWARFSPDPFPSYDCRLADMLRLTIDLIDNPPDEPVTRRIKPKAVFTEYIQPPRR